MTQPKRNWRLGEILVQKGWLTWQQLESALQIQQQTDKKVDNILLEKGFITKKESQSLCLGEILIKNKWLSWENLEKALELQRSTGRILGEILIDHKFVTKDHLYRGLAQQFGRPFVDFDNIKIPDEVIALVSKRFVHEQAIMPLLKQNGIFLFAISNPQDVRPEVELKKIITDCEIRFAIASPEGIQKAIQHYYP